MGSLSQGLAMWVCGHSPPPHPHVRESYPPSSHFHIYGILPWLAGFVTLLCSVTNRVCNLTGRGVYPPGGVCTRYMYHQTSRVLISRGYERGLDLGHCHIGCLGMEMWNVDDPRNPVLVEYVLGTQALHLRPGVW
jgi:hypothetical protein